MRKGVLTHYETEFSLIMRPSSHSLWGESSHSLRDRSLLLTRYEFSLAMWKLPLIERESSRTCEKEFPLFMRQSSHSLQNKGLLLRDRVLIHYVTEFSLATWRSCHSLRDRVPYFPLTERESSHTSRTSSRYETELSYCQIEFSFATWRSSH